MLNLGTLVLQEPYDLFYARTHQFIEVQHMMYFHLTSGTQKQRHTVHSGANRVTHPYKHILKPPVMCSQKLSILYGIYTEFHNVFAFQKLVTCRGHIFLQCVCVCFQLPACSIFVANFLPFIVLLITAGSQIILVH